MCGCNSSINSFLCYWAPILNGDDEKKYSTRMHTYEQTRERERERETSLFDNCVLLHQLSCWRHSFSSREGSVWNRNFNCICFNHRRLFAFYVMVKKKVYHHLHSTPIRKVNSGLLHCTIDRKSITIYIYKCIYDLLISITLVSIIVYLTKY